MKATRVIRQSCSDGLHFGLHDGCWRLAVLLFFPFFLDTIQNSGYVYPGKRYTNPTGKALINTKGQMYCFSNT